MATARKRVGLAHFAVFLGLDDSALPEWPIRLLENIILQCMSIGIAGVLVQNGGCVTVSVPHLGIMVEASLMEQVICNSIQELGYDRPRPIQLEAVLQFVSGRPSLHFIAYWKRQEPLLCESSIGV